MCAAYVPTYLKNSINTRSVSARYSLRANDDNWLLQTITSFNVARSQFIFLYASTNVWNSLPLSLREIETLYLFKNRQKAVLLFGAVDIDDRLVFRCSLPACFLTYGKMN